MRLKLPAVPYSKPLPLGYRCPPQASGCIWPLTASLSVLNVVKPPLRRSDFIPLIRILSNALAGPGKVSQPVYKLFHTSQLRILRKPRLVYGQRLYLAGMHLPKGDYFIVATTTYLSNIATL